MGSEEQIRTVIERKISQILPRWTTGSILVIEKFPFE